MPLSERKTINTNNATQSTTPCFLRRMVSSRYARLKTEFWKSAHHQRMHTRADGRTSQHTETMSTQSRCNQLPVLPIIPVPSSCGWWPIGYIPTTHAADAAVAEAEIWIVIRRISTLDNDGLHPHCTPAGPPPQSCTGYSHAAVYPPSIQELGARRHGRVGGHHRLVC